MLSSALPTPGYQRGWGFRWVKCFRLYFLEIQERGLVCNHRPWESLWGTAEPALSGWWKWRRKFNASQHEPPAVSRGKSYYPHRQAQLLLYKPTNISTGVLVLLESWGMLNFSLSFSKSSLTLGKRTNMLELLRKVSWSLQRSFITDWKEAKDELRAWCLCETWAEEKPPITSDFKQFSQTSGSIVPSLMGYTSERIDSAWVFSVLKKPPKSL